MSEPSALLGGRIQHAIDRLVADLAKLKGSSDHWTGMLSTSALSTATAISALSICRTEYQKKSWNIDSEVDPKYAPNHWGELVERGSHWLSQAQNSDGGFGDTDRSTSNIATTLLVLAAWQLAQHNQRYASQVKAAWAYVDRQGGWQGLRQRYGKDKTFVVPIMTNCALAGLVDWGKIPTLPFEAAALPQSWYRFAKMPVVSYAVPALVAIGQAQWHHAPPANPFLRWLRGISRKPTMRVLETMQPTSGGYLEAVPLTSFVLMSLASIDQGHARVARQSIRFLVDSVLSDGSWPIDTNLATWVTSLATPEYFSKADQDRDARSMVSEWNRTMDWLLTCQHVERHPFTGAEPGGWGWTNLSGAVPDADDTPAALLALWDWRTHCLEKHPLEHASPIGSIRAARVTRAALLGCRWLLRLQNSDGGWPTFCRGWGTLPFDRSGCDLTAHALRALDVWRGSVTDAGALQGHALSLEKIRGAMERGWAYLERMQNADGSWLPLWFGNQDRPAQDNPVYGTGRVLLCYRDCQRTQSKAFESARAYLMRNQNPDGGWGGGESYDYEATSTKKQVHSATSKSSTIEETAIALVGVMSQDGTIQDRDSIMMGLEWLCHAVENSHHNVSQPIGFYFAKLWYHEQMYPLVFALKALRKGLEFCQR